jgi:hypothetical protein
LQALVERVVSFNNIEQELPLTVSEPISFLHGDLIGGSPPNSIVRINRYNQLEWQIKRPGKELKKLMGRFSSLFVLYEGGVLECLDNRYGFKKWESKEKNVSQIVAGYPYLLTVNTNQELMPLDMKTGNPAWAKPIPDTQKVMDDSSSNILLVQHNRRISHVNAHTGAIIKSRSFKTPIIEMYEGGDEYWLVETSKRLFKVNKKTLKARVIDVGNPKDSAIQGTTLIVLDRDKKLLSCYSTETLELKWLTPIANLEKNDEILWGRDSVSVHRKNDNVVEIYSFQKGERVLELNLIESNWDHILKVSSHPLGTQLVFPTEIRLYGHSN